MVKYPGAEQYLPDTPDLLSLTVAAQKCRGCDLYRAAGPTVFGDGEPVARMMLVGEQPGNEEDEKGLPFVGPAGRLLDKALVAAGIDRNSVYLTNAVKHFRFEQKGKRRIHKKPSGGQVTACRPWLRAELHAVRPEIVVCLGVTAAQALLGKDFRLTDNRGTVLRLGDDFEIDPQVVATIHPSAVLRARPGRDEAFASLVRDLERAAQL